MNRSISIVLSLLLVAASVVAHAHEFTLVSRLSFQAPDTIVVELLDLTNSPVAGAAVTAAAGLPGKRLGRAQPLQEGPPGTYMGTISQKFDPAAEVRIEAISAQERFGITWRIDRGQQTPAVVRPLKAIDAEPGFAWSYYVVGAVGIVLLSLAAAAWYRGRRPS